MYSLFECRFTSSPLVLSVVFTSSPLVSSVVFRNTAALVADNDYTFPEVEQIKAFLKDPSAFAVVRLVLHSFRM